MAHSAPPAVSSCYGKIKHILLIFPEYLIPMNILMLEKNQAEKIEEIVLDHFKPITNLFSHTDKQVLFDFLVEHKVKLNPRKHAHFEKRKNQSPSSYGISPLYWLQWSPSIDNPNFPILLGGYHSPRPSANSKFLYRVLFTNIDFDEISREAMSALDISSTVLELDDDSRLVESIQDPFVPLNANGNVVILEPFFSWPTIRGFRSPFNFKNIPEVLSSQTEILIKSFPFYLQGGNILVGNDYVLIGGDIVKENVRAYKGIHKKEVDPEKFSKDAQKCSSDDITEDCFPDTLADFLGMKKGYCVTQFDEKKVAMEFVAPTSVRNNIPELFHLDVFLTLAGRTSVGNMELALLGQIHTWDGNEWVELKEKNASGRLRIVIAHLNACKVRLNEESGKFLVKRIPLLYDSGQFFSYNNCLVEVSNSCLQNELIQYQTTIYLPKFEWPEVDQCCCLGSANFADGDRKVESLLRGMGLNVEFIDMKFRALAHSRVGLHCMTSVLARYDHDLTRETEP